MGDGDPTLKSQVPQVPRKFHAAPGSFSPTNVQIQSWLPDILFFRSYWASGNNMEWADAMQLCENVGKGLVKWDTADKYLDMKHLTGQGAYWTALANTNGNGCNSPSVCDGLLVQSDK